MLIEKITFYPDRTDVFLTAYIMDAHLNQTRPAVLVCPGGGYFHCSEREGEPVALRFAAMGYHAFLLHYSTYLEGENAASIPAVGLIVPKPERAYPLPMQEIGQAMLILRDRAREWMLNPDQIILCGFSAGAHNCAMYATHWFEPVITEKFGLPAAQFRPAACILGYGVTDYLCVNEHLSADPVTARYLQMSAVAYFGTTEISDALFASASPARHVSEKTPPTFLWATAEDDLIPVQNTLLMAQALADHHVPFELHIFEQGGHALSLATQASAAQAAHKNKDVRKWVDLAEAWLEKRFALPLPDLVE